MLIVPFILQSAGSGLAKHFLFLPFFLSISAGYGLVKILGKMNKKYIKIALLAAILTIMILNLGNGFGTPPSYLSESGTSQLKSYINEKVGEDDIVFFDSRIYTAKGLWLATPNHVLNLLSVPDFLNEQASFPEENKRLTDVYIIECVTDDCGWGTISSQPELNETMELILAQLKQGTDAQITIRETEFLGNEFFGEKNERIVYQVYKHSILLDTFSVSQTDNMNSFYFAPYLYKNLNNFIYNYTPIKWYDLLLNNLAYYIILLSMLISIIIVLWLLGYFFYKL